MLTSHKLLERYWHDARCDKEKVRIWYIDRGAPDDRSSAVGADISLEPYYLRIRTADGEKPVPYHRILLISYDGNIAFENLKIEGQAERIINKELKGGYPDLAGTSEEDHENEQDEGMSHRFAD